MKRLIPLLALVALLAPAPAGAAAPLRIVAAENVWGSIASQLGGPYVQVTSLITNPATDPHAYEPNAIDARTLAGARLVIVNGIGYDPWAPKLLAANPVKGRVLLTVGDVVGVKPGGNPHRWYAPGDVAKVIAAIALAYERLDPPHARQFAQLEHVYETRVLSAYHAEIAVIRRLFHGAPVGASESIFAPLAQALGLDLVTPPSFLKAISEGTEPTAGDKRAVDRQVATRAIKVWVYNSQNSTPDVARITEAARKRGIPVTTITETLTPPTASFQDWQVAQLRALRAALQRAGAR